MSKKEMIKNGEDVSLDDGNVVVLNKVSVAEKTPVSDEKETAPQSAQETEEKVKEPQTSEVKAEPETAVVSQEEAPVIPVVPETAEPQIDVPVGDVNAGSVAPIDLSGIIPPGDTDPEDPTKYPEVPSNPADAVQNDFSANNNMFSFPNSFSQESETPSFVGSFDNGNQNDNALNQSAFAYGLNNFDGGVFKTESDVDASFEKFMADVRKSYDEHISGPTKTLVEFVIRFVNWGNQVTANGLNRKLFDEYDELIALLNKQKPYKDEMQKTSAGFGYNDNPLNNYGDDQINNGGMGMSA